MLYVASDDDTQLMTAAMIVRDDAKGCARSGYKAVCGARLSINARGSEFGALHTPAQASDVLHNNFRPLTVMRCIFSDKFVHKMRRLSLGCQDRRLRTDGKPLPRQRSHSAHT